MPKFKKEQKKMKRKKKAKVRKKAKNQKMHNNAGNVKKMCSYNVFNPSRKFKIFF